MDPQESIWIGPEKYIQWNDFDPQGQTILEIDTLAPFSDLNERRDPLSQFLNKTETECMVECCGIDAHRFWPEDIARATQDIDKISLLDQLTSIKEVLSKNSEQVVVYHRLNQLFDKRTFLEFIDYLIREVKSRPEI